MHNVARFAEILHKGTFGEVPDGVFGNGRNIAFRREESCKIRGGRVPDLWGYAVIGHKILSAILSKISDDFRIFLSKIRVHECFSNVRHFDNRF